MIYQLTNKWRLPLSTRQEQELKPPHSFSGLALSPAARLPQLVVFDYSTGSLSKQLQQL